MARRVRLWARVRAARFQRARSTLLLAEEAGRQAKIAALRVYLAELAAERGPIPADEMTAARTWADGIWGPRPDRPGAE